MTSVKFCQPYVERYFSACIVIYVEDHSMLSLVDFQEVIFFLTHLKFQFSYLDKEILSFR